MIPTSVELLWEAPENATDSRGNVSSTGSNIEWEDYQGLLNGANTSGSGNTTEGPGSGNITVVQGSGNITVEPGSDNITAGPGSGNVTAGPGSGNVTVDPGSNVTTVGPGSNVTTVGPVSGVTTEGPGSGVTTAGPGSGVTTVGPGSGVTTAGPGSGVTTVGPGSGLPPVGSVEGDKHLQDGQSQYVGCLVDGGYPRPIIAIVIGKTEVKMTEVSYHSVKTPSPHTGPAGYEVKHYRQRADHVMKVTWQHDLRTVKCLVRTASLPDMINGTTLHVKGSTRLTVSS